MSNKTIAVVGAISAMAAGAPAIAAEINQGPAVPPAASYADLLQPIPNAVERLRQAEAEAAARPAVLIQAQYVDHHHHHHHHHNQVVVPIVPFIAPAPHHHHHHHHKDQKHHHNHN